MRKWVLFEPEDVKCREVVHGNAGKLYRQEQDWTCSIACIRTLLSGFLPHVDSEEFFLEMYRMKPGPYYSKDIKRLGVLTWYDTVYGCDVKGKNFDLVLRLMQQGYGVMLESMYNYAHWMVLMGFFPAEDFERAKLLMYDPYYDEVRLLNADEFLGMWMDGDHEKNGVEKDFIAVRSRT